MVNGKFDPTAGLASSGIAGTAPEKEDEENKNANADEEMKDVSKKDGGKLILSFASVLHTVELLNFDSTFACCCWFIFP